MPSGPRGSTAGRTSPGTARACPRRCLQGALAHVAQADEADVDRAVAVADAAARPPPDAGARAGRGCARPRTSSTTSRPTRRDADRAGRQTAPDERARSVAGVALLRQCAEEISRLHGENLTLDGVPGGDGRWGLTCRGALRRGGRHHAVQRFRQPDAAEGRRRWPSAMPSSSSRRPRLRSSRPSWPRRSTVPCRQACCRSCPAVRRPRRLVSRPAVRAVSLTGGVAAGEAVRAAAGIKPVYLELGANSPNIVCADATSNGRPRRSPERRSARKGSSASRRSG